jgi:hypothetical protein
LAFGHTSADGNRKRRSAAPEKTEKRCFPALEELLQQSMIRKTGNRFSENIMLNQNPRAKSIQSETILL